MKAGRRRFVQAGIAGAIALAAAGAFLLPRGEGAGKRAGDRRALIAALAQALLAGALPERSRADALAAVAGRVEQAIAALSAPAQREVGELLALLEFAPVRFALARIAVPWDRADEAEVAAFLERLRSSRLALLQPAYHGLHDLVIGSWYAGRESWEAIGYPGPPELP
ncbi:MAG: hypothetical protein OHK0026_16190 [Rhodocyclaceae bacterium]